jgi:uncharacterized protein
VAPQERSATLDLLRGVAILGILPVNIPGFALPEAVFWDPGFAGGFTGVDYAAWWITHVFFELKMLTLLALLFGAGMAMQSDRARESGTRMAGSYAWRMAILLVFGVIHAYTLWIGDILVTYALVAMLVFPMRRIGTRWLVGIAIGLLMVAVAINASFGGLFWWMRRAAELVATQENPPGWASSMASSWDLSQADFAPTPEALAQERAGMLGTYTEFVRHQAPAALEMHTMVLGIWGLWRVSGVMLLGIVAHRLGVLTGRRSTRFYAWMAAIGLGVGIPVILLGVRSMHAHQFSFVELFLMDWWFNYFASLFVVAGYIGLLVLWSRSGAAGFVRRALERVGRTAFSCYIAQSILCVMVFNGFGFALWGELSRAELWIVVAGIWAVLLVGATVWLRWFRFGPLEWVWRSLAYRRAQPMVVRCGAAVDQA